MTASVTLDRVLAATVIRSGFTEAAIRGKSRERPLVDWRQRAMLAMRWAVDGPPSYPTIGHYFGGRDHKTVMHACANRVDDPVVAELIALAERIGSEEDAIGVPIVDVACEALDAAVDALARLKVALRGLRT